MVWPFKIMTIKDASSVEQAPAPWCLSGRLTDAPDDFTGKILTGFRLIVQYESIKVLKKES